MFQQSILDSVRDTLAPWTPYSIFGRNSDVDIAAAEDIFNGGGVFVAPTAARVHAIVSASADDAAAGTGARTVVVRGINGSYAIVNETVTLNGTTPVNTSASFLHIYRIDVATAGSGGVPAGAITATAATDSTVTDRVAVGLNRSQSTVFQLPASVTGYLKRFYALLKSATTGAEALIQLKVKTFGDSAFHVEKEFVLNKADKPFITFDFADRPLVLTAKDIIKVTATVNKDNSDIAAGYDLITLA